MSITLTISTYNWPAALELVLKSVSQQTRLPDEVIIADDGSGDVTRHLIERLAQDFPVPLRHIWQQDQGFRLARSRNRAIAAARGDYIIIIDGDMVLHPQFIADHASAARLDSFVQGSRVLTSPKARDRMLAGQLTRLRFFDPSLDRRRHTLRMMPLSRLLLSMSRTTSKVSGTKGCNQAWWRSDLLRLNGYDERMQSWGREDTELVLRAFHAGLQRRSLRFSGLAFHLYHEERHQDGASANDVYVAETRATRARRCALGIDQHLAEFVSTPAADLRPTARQQTSA